MAGGAPLGNDNATKNRLWADTLRRALLAEDGKKLRSLAEKLIARAEEGDTSALKEIGDRIDGKSKQQTELSGPDGSAIPHSLTVEFVGAK
jgi:hypothetical protein